MLQSGMLTQQEARALLDYPDLEAVNQLATASQELFNKIIDEAISNGRYNPPEPFMNLAMGIQMVQSAYLKAKIDNVPEVRLDLLRRFLQDSIAMLASMQQQAAAPPMEQDVAQQGTRPNALSGQEAAQEQVAAPMPT